MAIESPDPLRQALGMSPLLQFDVGDLKVVYRALHSRLLEHSELMDSALFMELQRCLQLKARADGVDLADHARWDDWLAQGAEVTAGGRPRRAFRPETD